MNQPKPNSMAELLGDPSLKGDDRGPDVGVVVAYVLPDGAHKGEVRPAMVVRSLPKGCVNLLVMLDGPNDPGTANLKWVGTVSPSGPEEAMTPGTWHPIPDGNDDAVGYFHDQLADLLEMVGQLFRQSVDHERRLIQLEHHAGLIDTAERDRRLAKLTAPPAAPE